MTDPRSRLIVALDVPDREAALAAARRLQGHVGCLKIGLQLFIAEGPSIVNEIRQLRHRVFLDLKLHDIPNTVAGAVQSAARLGVHFLTVHASGGAKMLEAARAAAEKADNPPLLLAVTALTSLTPGDCADIGVAGNPAGWVERLAGVAERAGIRGLVCSASELPLLRTSFSQTTLVVPGIRPAGSDAQDQARTATPREALGLGADYIVVGRPIMRAADPALAAERVVADLTAGTQNQ